MRYCLNNPLVYVDPDGEFVIAAALIGMGVAALIDYGVQVGLNHMKGYRGKEAWFGQVDFVDVGISGAVGFLTAGSAASLKLADAGVKTASGFSQFLARPGTKQFIKHGSKVLSESIDYRPSRGLEIIGRDKSKSIANVAVSLGTSYVIDFAGRKITEQISDRVVRKKAIEYQWALRDGATRHELSRLQSEYELLESINSLHENILRLRPAKLDMPGIDYGPVMNLLKKPMQDAVANPIYYFYDYWYSIHGDLIPGQNFSFTIPE